MSPGNSRIVLSVEQHVSLVDSTCLSGSVDFAAISTTEKHAKSFLQDPLLTKLSEKDHALFVSGPKGPNQRLMSHLPQAICEMHACAKQLGKTVIRGVLTNGHSWIFVILELNEDGNGGKYLYSPEIMTVEIGPGENKSVSETCCSLVAGILAHWIQHSHTKIGDDDYFTIE